MQQVQHVRIMNTQSRYNNTPVELLLAAAEHSHPRAFSSALDPAECAARLGSAP
jgi:hypothetical protein